MKEKYMHRTTLKGQPSINKQLGLGEKNGSAMLEYEKRRGFLNEM